MAITPSIVATAVQSDRTEWVATDEGVYTSPTRTGVGVYLKMYKVDQSSVRTELDITPNSADAEVVSSWTVEYTVDGHYQGDYIAVPDYDNGTAYVLYDVVYLGGVVYRALQSTTGNTPPNVTYWEVISDPTSLVANDGEANESANATVYVFNDILTADTEYLFGNIAEEVALEFGNTSAREEDVETYEMVAVLLDGMWIAAVRQEFSNGEKIARKTDGLDQ